MRVLFVCTGNICRSPMGELMTQLFLPPGEVSANSAGTHGLDAHPIDPSSGRLMAQDGIDPSGFRSKRLVPELADGSDLILCFEQEHIKGIANLSPRSARKTFLLPDFANACLYCLRNGYVEGDRIQDRCESVMDNASMIRPMLPEAPEIVDPIGKEFPVFEKAHEQIAQAMRMIAVTLLPPSGGRGRHRAQTAAVDPGLAMME